MKVGDLFKRLSFGELSNLSIGMEGTGSIEESQQDKLVSHTETALTEIYSRILHRRETIQIALREGRKVYDLDPAFSVSHSTPEQSEAAYILDSEEEPFGDDVIRILRVWEELPYETGDLLPPDHEPIEARIESFDRIVVKNPRDGAILNVTYQARHKRLSVPADLDERIVLAPLLESALQLRVGSLVYENMDGEAQIAKSQILFSRYETILNRVKLENLIQEAEPEETALFGKRGWI